MRAIWTGSISFGLVTIPVQLFTAAKAREFAFHFLHEVDNSRVKNVRYCAAENRPVPDGELVRGYEYEKGRYVKLTEDELAGVDPRGSRSIEILDFVDSNQIDVMFFAKPYYLQPVSGGDKAYRLFNTALAGLEKTAVGQCVIRDKQHLVAIKPLGSGLIMEMLRYPEELIDPAPLWADREWPELTPKELELAEALITQLAAEFEPAKYQDGYTQKLRELVERKLSGEEVVSPSPPKLTPVVDLVAALKSSLEESKKAG